MSIVKYYLLLVTGLFVALVGCEEFEDERLDFTNSQPQFVQLSPGGAVAAAAGDTVVMEIEVRENLYTEINVNYEVTGDLSQSGTATIPTGELDTAIELILPAGTTGEAIFTLTGVDNGLSVGRPNTAASATTATISWE